MNLKDPRQMTQDECVAEIERLRGSDRPLSQEEMIKKNLALALEAMAEQQAGTAEERAAAEEKEAREEAARQQYAKTSTVQTEWLRRCVDNDEERMQNMRNQEALNLRNVEATERMAVAIEKLALCVGPVKT